MVNNDVKQLKNMAENIQRKEELISKLNSSKELLKKYMDASCMPCYETFECKELKDYDNKLNVFVHAPMSFKKSRIQEQYEIPEAKVKDVAIKTDKQRASYYNYYTSKKWGDLKSYDLCIDSSILGIDGTVELIKQAVALKEKNL